MVPLLPLNLEARRVKIRERLVRGSTPLLPLPQQQLVRLLNLPTLPYHSSPWAFLGLFPSLLRPLWDSCPLDLEQGLSVSAWPVIVVESSLPPHPSLHLSLAIPISSSLYLSIPLSPHFSTSAAGDSLRSLSTEQLQQLEGMERANVEARISVLRDVQKLLDSAVLRLNQYSTVMAVIRCVAAWRFCMFECSTDPLPPPFPPPSPSSPSLLPLQSTSWPWLPRLSVSSPRQSLHPHPSCYCHCRCRRSISK